MKRRDDETTRTSSTSVALSDEDRRTSTSKNGRVSKHSVGSMSLHRVLQNLSQEEIAQEDEQKRLRRKTVAGATPSTKANGDSRRATVAANTDHLLQQLEKATAASSLDFTPPSKLGQEEVQYFQLFAQSILLVVSFKTECPICLDTTFTLTVVVRECQHSFCQPCMTEYFRNKAQEAGGRISNVHFVLCPMPGCSTRLYSGQLAATSPATAVATGGSTAQAQPRQSPFELTNWQRIMDRLLPMPYLYGKRLFGDVTGSAVASGMDLATQAWLRTFAKRCPNCGAYVIKDGGCDHVVCTCGYHFYWRDR